MLYVTYHYYKLSFNCISQAWQRSDSSHFQYYMCTKFRSNISICTQVIARTDRWTDRQSLGIQLSRHLDFYAYTYITPQLSQIDFCDTNNRQINKTYILCCNIMRQYKYVNIFHQLNNQAIVDKEGIIRPFSHTYLVFLPFSRSHLYRFVNNNAPVSVTTHPHQRYIYTLGTIFKHFYNRD